SVNPRARTEQSAKWISAGAERLADRAADVEPAAVVVAPQPARAPFRPVDDDLRDQLPHALELGGRQRREVLRPEELVGAVAARLARLLGRLLVAVAALAEVRALEGAALAPLHDRLERPRRPQEPRVECPVEHVDLLVPRDERGAQRPVDVVAPGAVDVIEPGERVGDAAGADLESRLAQDPAERDDVPNERVAGINDSQPVPPRRAPRAPSPGPPADPRGA